MEPWPNSRPGRLGFPQAYHDPRTRLEVHFPAGWRVDQFAANLVIMSYRESESRPQVGVAANGALISFVAVPRGTRSASDWLDSTRTRPANGYSISGLDLATLHFGAVHVVVARRHPDVEEDMTSLSYIFEVHGELVKASLVYSGRVHAAAFEDTLREVVRNLEWSVK